MSDIEGRLRASVRLRAYDGDAMERGVCAAQMRDAADEIERLRAAQANFLDRVCAAEALLADCLSWFNEGPDADRPDYLCASIRTFLEGARRDA